MHHIQEKLLEIVEKKNLSAKTLREIGELIGETSPQKIKHHLMQLEKKGFVKIDPKTKGVSKMVAEQKGNLISVPVVGMANCGPATIFANENIENFLKVSARLLKRKENLFAVRAQGLSMNNAKVDGNSIEDGDYLIIDSTDTVPNNGDIVLSVIDSMANIKKYLWDDENNQVVLVSDSSRDFPPIYIHEDDNFIINGKVIQVIKKPKF